SDSRTLKKTASPCQLIQSGSPKIYQLNTVTKITEGLKTVTVGTKKVNELNKTILLLGETGTGKSTLINVLVNYAMGVKWGHEVWFKIVEEETTSQSESQTSDVIMYQIFGFEGKRLPFSLTLVDTPGYGDNRDDTNDDSIAERLLEWFTSDGGIHEVHAVGLVLKASDNRLSDRLGYVFDSVASLFGANMEKNMFALLTHSGGGPPKNALTALADAQIKYAKDEQGEPVYFKFDNCQSDQRTERYMRKLKNAWKDSEDEMKRFMEVLNVTEAQTLRTTVEVINQRNQLKDCIINLQDKLKFIELKKTQIDQEKAFSIKCEEKMKANENYEEDVDEPYKDKEPIKGGRWWFFWVKGATSCLQCEETCHHKFDALAETARPSRFIKAYLFIHYSDHGVFPKSRWLKSHVAAFICFSPAFA
uniref:Septin-type G domain-containing protein n=1 Tax=Takifugu rubripes TaxID=31033 RepID=A0A674PFK7_TAKRU